MAGEAERRRARCAAVLARCQTLREQAAQAAASRARGASEAAEQARVEAQEALAQAGRLRSEGMRQRYAALVGTATGETGLRALRDTGARLVAECGRAADALAQAQARASAAHEAAQAAARSLMVEVRSTRRREGMAQAARDRLGAALAALEDAAMDDETSDRAASRHARG